MNPSDDELERSGLLQGLTGDERSARLALIRELGAAGVSLETMREAAEEDRLALLPVEVALGADYRHTVAETAEASGLPAELLVRQRMALGPLGEVASEVARPPVRLVKLIGDAAMLVSPEADVLVDAALKLIAAGADGDRLPPLRAGIAMGPALRRGGDWYGHTVNLASRVCEEAPSGGLAVTEPRPRPWRIETGVASATPA